MWVVLQPYGTGRLRMTERSINNELDPDVLETSVDFQANGFKHTINVSLKWVQRCNRYIRNILKGENISVFTTQLVTL